MNKIKVVFFGTHKFATVILQGLMNSPIIDVKLVVTRPDKPVGRKKTLTPPPVKVLAIENDIEVVQPKSLKNNESLVLDLKSIDLGVTAQFGALIPKEILNAPKHGILNVHTSLLPKYRGGAPIQSALINGETETGVTIMKMGVGLDTGPILLQKSIIIDRDDTYVTLDKKMAPVGRDVLLEAIQPYVSGKLEPIEQDENGVTESRQLSREDGKVDWKNNSVDIYNQYRAMTPWPGIFTEWNGKRLKLLVVVPSDESVGVGDVVKIEDKILIGCIKGSLELIDVQLEGKKAMDIKTFVNGFSDFVGSSVV